MYGVFDKFLNTDTWDQLHPSDERRFYLALSEVVRHPDFNADAMDVRLRASSKNPPRLRNQNLSRRKPEKSSSSNRRLSSAIWRTH